MKDVYYIFDKNKISETLIKKIKISTNDCIEAEEICGYFKTKHFDEHNYHIDRLGNPISLEEVIKYRLLHNG